MLQRQRKHIGKRNELLGQIDAVRKIRQSKPDMSTWDGNECRHYLQYKKKKGDAAMPKGTILLRHKCQEVHQRVSLFKIGFSRLNILTNYAGI